MPSTHCLRDQLRHDIRVTHKAYEAQVQTCLKRARGSSPYDVCLRPRPEPLQNQNEEECEQTFGTGLAGDEIIRQIHTNIREHLHITPFSYQAETHERLIRSILPLIYGDDWEPHQTRILKHWGLDRIRPYVICSAPRREGKTWTLTMLTAAMMDLLPGQTMVVFSLSQRVSKMYMDKVREFYYRMPGGRDRVAVSNNEDFIVSPSGDKDDPRRFHLMCLPNSDKSRGLSPNILVYEEAQFMSQEVQQAVGAPTMMMKNMAMWAISSPGMDRNNYIAQLMSDEERNPDSLYDIFRRELMCIACTNAKKTDCGHKLEERPPWKSKTKEAAIKRAYAHDPIGYQREIMGMEVSSDITAFEPEDIQMFFDETRRYKPTEEPGWLFHCIDTSNGGEGQSDTAWVSLYFNRYQQPVVSPFWCRITCSGVQNAAGIGPIGLGRSNTIGRGGGT